MSTLTAEQKRIEAAGSSILGRPRRLTSKVDVLGSERGANSQLGHLVRMFRRTKTAAIIDDFQFIPGMIYTSVRAISARINQNYDAWPSEELAKSFHTFLGKPIFVNHINFDPERARGRVVASRYIEKNADHCIQTIMETDALRYPELGKEIREGGLDSVSMGVEAGFTICSYCGNKATDVFDMCDHVKFHKGMHLPDPATGEPKLVFENCYKLGFFELSYVFDPADETAVINSVIVAGKKKKAWGEVRAPEDIDTLRLDDKDSSDDYQFVEPYHGDDEDPNIPFQSEIPTIPELRTPDFDQAHRLDRVQEEEGLDGDRRVEDVGEVGAPEDEEQPMTARPRAAHKSRRAAMGRTKYAAQEDEDGRPPWLTDRDGGGDEDRDDDSDNEEERGGDESEDHDEESDHEDESDRGDDRDDDEGDDGEDRRPPQFAAKRPAPRRRARRRTAEDDDKDDSDSDDDGDDEDSDDDKPPWLKEKESRRQTSRRPVNSRSSAQKKRKGTKGAPPMGAPTLSGRSKAAAAGRRQHFADDSGHTDGGPYGENNLGEQAETYIPTVYGDESDGVPPEEPVAAPTGDGSKEPNSESNLVASINATQAQLNRQIAALNAIHGRRRTAEGVEDPTTVNPELSGTDDQSLKGDDFQDTGLSDTQTQPTDGSRSADRHWFAEFDKWVHKVTGGKTWKNLSSGQLTRAAAAWSKHANVPLDAMFPTLDSALRQAKKAEDSRKRASMNRTADESLEVAAPDDRVDTEKPVSGETDADAQASQFPIGDFGSNAFDQDAEPEMSVDSQIWAPGEGGSGTTASREMMADGMSATRCAEAYIACRLVDPADKWKVAAWLQSSVRQSMVEDRTKLMEAIYAANQHMLNPPVRRHAAAEMRGPVPQGFGAGPGRTMTAQQRIASELDDPRYDASMWLG